MGSPPLTYRRHWLRLVVVVLAMAAQLAGATFSPGDATASARLAALDGLGVVCQGGQPAIPAPNRPHHAADPALCPACIAHTAPLALLAGAAVLVGPRQTLALRAPRPEWLRAGAADVPEAAFPRGPPSLA